MCPRLRTVRMRALLPAARAIVLLGAAWLPVFAAQAAAQSAPTTDQLEERERVTAVDVLVELDADSRDGSDKVRALPRELTLEDFEVRIDGEARTVVGFFDPRTAAEREGQRFDEPWRIVLYFDLELAERDTVRWAAGELADLAPLLVESGEVELIIAGDGESRGLAPTRDHELLGAELAGLYLRPRGAHRQIELRAEVLEALREEPQGLKEAGIANALVEQEVALVESRLDELMLRLTDEHVPGVKQALLWVGDGVDLEPEKFYTSQGLEVDRMPMLLRERSAKLAVTLASYGWVGVTLSPPPADAGLVPGFRIGKWLFSRRGSAEALLRGELAFVRLTREARRDPDEASAHYQVGLAHLAAEEYDQAEDSFEAALYHYAGDPRTSKEQAAAKAGLGRALEAQGHEAEARQAFRHAADLDPGLAGDLPPSGARLLDPLAFQETLAQSTAGRLVEDREYLAEAIASLSNRARLTFQISGVPRGDVRRLEVSLAGSDLELRFPSWTRSGTPSAIPAARARRSVDGDFDDGALQVRARVDSKAGENRSVVVEIELDSLGQSAEGDAAIPLRITTATGAPGTVQDVRYQKFEVTPAGPGAKSSYRLPIEPAIEDGWVAVIVEDLDTGRWGADLVD